jgi:hypothetical protein
MRKFKEKFQVRPHSFPPIQAQKIDFPAGRLWPVKKLIRSINDCSFGPGPIKIQLHLSLSASETAQK